MANILHTMPLKVEKILSSWNFRRMRLDERGAYMTLLMEAWLMGAKLPCDKQDLLRTLGIDNEEQEKRISKLVIDRMFTLSVDGNYLTNETLTDVWEEALETAKKSSERGQKGANVRWHKKSSGTKSRRPAQGKCGKKEDLSFASQDAENQPDMLKHCSSNAKAFFDTEKEDFSDTKKSDKKQQNGVKNDTKNTMNCQSFASQDAENQPDMLKHCSSNTQAMPKQCLSNGNQSQRLLLKKEIIKKKDSDFENRTAEEILADNSGFKEPTVQEVLDYALSPHCGFPIDKETAEIFLDHYRSIGWTVKGTPVTDWKARLRNWKRNQHNFQKKETAVSKKNAHILTEMPTDEEYEKMDTFTGEFE